MGIILLKDQPAGKAQFKVTGATLAEISRIVNEIEDFGKEMSQHVPFLYTVVSRSSEPDGSVLLSVSFGAGNPYLMAEGNAICAELFASSLRQRFGGDQE